MVSLKGLDKQKVSASSIEHSLAGQDVALDTLRSEIKNNSTLASSMTSMLRAMSQQFDWFTKLLVSVKSLLSQGFRLNLATYRAVMSIQQSLGHSMDRTLIQDPFVLEDPLGRVAPVHLQFITSWNAFYAVLAARFEGLPGHNKIERREFVLQERATSREISDKEPWEISFRPGASVLMSLVFQRDVKAAEANSHCPYCGSISERQTADDVHWSVVNTPLCMIYQSAKIYSIKCGMVYRRVTEVTEVDQPTIPGLPDYWSQRPSFGRSGFNNQSPTLGPFLKRKRTMESWEELSLSEEVRSFKRVKILSNIRKARRTAFALWEYKTPWVATEKEQTATVALDDCPQGKSTRTIETGYTFRNLHSGDSVLSEASPSPLYESEDPEGGSYAHTMASNNEIHRLSTSRCSLATNHHPLVDDANIELGHEALLLRSAFATNLNRIYAKRAQLLQCLNSKPILAPVSEPVGQILGIESAPSQAWPFVGKFAVLL